MRVWVLEHQQSPTRVFSGDFDMHDYLKDDIRDAELNDDDFEYRVESDNIYIDDWLHARLVEVENGSD
jgi:poly-beta-hydroxyalkanoate depolymerase